MINNVRSLLIGALLFFYYSATAQQSTTVQELLNLEKNKYFVDRDTALANPYVGIKKQIYGNRRFAQDKSEIPRRTDKVLKAAALGQEPFATIIGCSDSRCQTKIYWTSG